MDLHHNNDLLRRRAAFVGGTDWEVIIWEGITKRCPEYREDWIELEDVYFLCKGQWPQYYLVQRFRKWCTFQSHSPEINGKADFSSNPSFLNEMATSNGEEIGYCLTQLACLGETVILPGTCMYADGVSVVMENTPSAMSSTDRVDFERYPRICFLEFQTANTEDSCVPFYCCRSGWCYSLS